MKREIVAVGLNPQDIDLRRFSIEAQVPLIMAKVPQTIAKI